MSNTPDPWSRVSSDNHLDGGRAHPCSRSYNPVMDVLQCPECPLRFRFASELDQHLVLEHPEFHAEARKAMVENSVVEAAHHQRRRHRHHDPRESSP